MPFVLCAAIVAAAVALLAAIPAGAVEAGLDPGQDTGSNSRACPRDEEAVRVPGAEFFDADCLRDLTTAGTERTGHTNRDDWNGLHASGTRNPSGVPGLQIDGYFPDRSRTNANNGFNHDSQFVMRFPNRWNGKLVITGAPGVRRQYANDFIISDWVLARGYAFASTDKGNTGVAFYDDGSRPGGSVAEWHRRVEQLTRAAKAAARSNYGREPRRTYITGISNGGYLTRYALENTPGLYDGGVDWEGTLFRAEGPNLFTFLPPALRNYPEYRAGSQEARDDIIEAGFQPGSEFLWDYHYLVYWDLTQRIYREEFDPGYDGDLEAGIPFCQEGTPNCDADYDYGSRPEAVREAVARVQNTGRIGRPMITLHGDLDTLLPIRKDSDVYRRLVGEAGRAGIHRYLVVEDGNHVDGLYDEYPERLRPILPCYRDAFAALDRAVDRGGRLPKSGYLPRPKDGDVVNDCNLTDTAPRPGGGTGGDTGGGGGGDEGRECTITGTRGDDALRGTWRADVICGLGGDDAIEGLGGDDVLRGGSGRDALDGGGGADEVTGGPGRDALGGGDGRDRLDARDGVRRNDAVSGGSGRDVCRADPGDAVRGCP